MSRTSLREASVELKPTVDGSDDAQIYDVVGTKADAAISTNSDDASLIAYLKGLLGVQSDVLGGGLIGRAVTATLFVSPNGDGTDGKTWHTAYTGIEDALDAASTDINECTQILVAINTGPNNYDINRTGDPTWSGNYIIKGSHRNWVKIKNTHDDATSIFKFTGYASLQDININLGAGDHGVNGVIMTKGGFRIDNCMFVGEDLTVAASATAIHVDGATSLKNGKIRNCDIKGEATGTYMTGILLDNAECAELKDLRVGFCSSGVQQVGASSALNKLGNVEFCSNTIGVNIDAGTGMLFENINFTGNDLNFDDEVGGSSFRNIEAASPISQEPDDFTGVSVNTGDGADTWTAADVEVRAAATSTKPFRIVGVNVNLGTEEYYRVRLTADGTNYFDDFQVEGIKKSVSFSFPSGTDYVFNAGTQIKASSKSESDGVDNLVIWLKIQEI